MKDRKVAPRRRELTFEEDTALREAVNLYVLDTDEMDRALKSVRAGLTAASAGQPPAPRARILPVDADETIKRRRQNVELLLRLVQRLADRGVPA